MGIIFHIGYVARISHLCRREKFITDAVLWWLQSYVFAIVISAKSWKRLVRGNQQIIFNSLLATVSNTHGSPLFHEQRKLSWRLVYVHRRCKRARESRGCRAFCRLCGTPCWQRRKAPAKLSSRLYTSTSTTSTTSNVFNNFKFSYLSCG